MSFRLVVAVTAAVLSAHAPSATAAPDPPDLALRLADVGPGYYVPEQLCVSTHLRGDGRSRANGIGRRRYRSRTVSGIGRLRHRGCEIELWRMWVTPGMPAGPQVVSSRVFVFDDARGPQLALARPRAIASFMYFDPHRNLRVVEPAPAVGDEAVLLRAPKAFFADPPAPRAIVLWRSGTVLAAMEVTGEGTFDATAQIALRLAAAQQARIAVPTSLDPADNDQSEVGLSTPGFALPVHWLGRELPARGRLPALSLIASLSHSLFRRDAMNLAYGRDRDIGIVVRLAHPRMLRDPIIRDLLSLIASDRCMHRKEVMLAAGRATIWTRRGRGCDARPENTLAIARLPGVVVTINVGAKPGPLTRYATQAGMRRLLRALRPRAPLGEAPAPPAG